jgi:hypothetical protein
MCGQCSAGTEGGAFERKNERVQPWVTINWGEILLTRPASAPEAFDRVVEPVP